MPCGFAPATQTGVPELHSVPHLCIHGLDGWSLGAVRSPPDINLPRPTHLSALPRTCWPGAYASGGHLMHLWFGAPASIGKHRRLLHPSSCHCCPRRWCMRSRLQPSMLTLNSISALQQHSGQQPDKRRKTKRERNRTQMSNWPQSCVVYPRMPSAVQWVRRSCHLPPP